MDALATAVAVLVAALAAYSLGHYLCALVFAVSAGRRRRALGDPPPDAVTVLIPALDEGPAAVHAIRSVLAQDHEGPVEAWLLVNGPSDSSMPYLRGAFEATVADDAELVELTRDPDRRAVVRFCGVDPKSAKIRAALEAVETPYVAILDCDHVAHRRWIGSALAHLAASRETRHPSRIIQGRRYPQSARRLFRLWDSLHQHVGCELLNAAFTRLGLTVFFTGTTAVMETALLRAHPPRDVITEDADLSYDLVLDGEVILSDPTWGSREALSPDLYSFLARRRRWANGHTQAFLRHLPRLLGARLPLLAKLQFLFHGAHYLVAIPVFVLHALIGLLVADGLPAHATGASLLCALGLAWAVTRGQGTRGVVHRALEIAVVWAWLAPAAILATNLVTAALLGDPARAALPLPAELAWLPGVALAAFLAPLALVLVGLLGFGQAGLGTVVALVLTYPVAFYLDMAGALLGALDRVAGRRRWRRVARADGDPDHPLDAPPVHDLAHSCAVGGDVDFAPEPTPRRRGARAAFALALAAVFGAGVIGPPTQALRIEDTDCRALTADGHPWITPADELDGWCTPAGHRPRLTMRSGTYRTTRRDPLTSVDPSFWTRGDATFPCNESHFHPDNVAPGPGGARLIVRREDHGGRRFTAGALETHDRPEAMVRYGRFEVEMRPADVSGVVSAFFLYRFDPWQEIDLEFVGNDTTRVLLNVYYNPGDDGDLYNYGHYGTPVSIDLGFDAADAVHRYAIEWDADEIRWFVDGHLIHARRGGEPTPIPHLPMRFYANAWITCSEALAGPLDEDRLPTEALVRSVSIARWDPLPATGLRALIGWSDPPRDAWMQP